MYIDKNQLVNCNCVVGTEILFLLSLDIFVLQLKKQK